MKLNVAASVRRSVKGAIKLTGLRRRHLAASRMYCERHALASMKPRRERPGGRILCYHSFGQAELGVNDVQPVHLRQQLELALNAGYRFVPAQEIARTGGLAKDLAITLDDGWRTVLTAAAPIFQEYQIPWTLFVVTGWSDQNHPFSRDAVLTWSEIEKCINLGAEIGSHSVTHPDFGVIGADLARDELIQSREIINRRLGIEVDTFAIPLGQSMNWSFDASASAKIAGYKIVYAQAEDTRPQGTVGRTFVTCFDHHRTFKALLSGAYDRWEEWY